MASQSNLFLKRLGRGLLGAFGISASVLAIYVLALVAHHNFHTVSPGRVYRSSQMSAAALAEAIRQEGVKSVINLRGGSSNDAWYREETATAQRLGARYYDFPLSAGRELTDSQLDQIIEIIDHAPKPLLIHCKSGSDRTGLLSALYLYHCEGRSARDADGQLTLRYGHVPYLFWRDTVAMDRSFWHYVSGHSRGAVVPLEKSAGGLPDAGASNQVAGMPAN